MSDKLRKKFDSTYTEIIVNCIELDAMTIEEMQFQFYKAATERAARICDNSQCCECGSGELLAKEIRGE